MIKVGYGSEAEKYDGIIRNGDKRCQSKRSQRLQKKTGEEEKRRVILAGKCSPFSLIQFSRTSDRTIIDTVLDLGY